MFIMTSKNTVMCYIIALYVLIVESKVCTKQETDFKVITETYEEVRTESYASHCYMDYNNFPEYNLYYDYNGYECNKTRKILKLFTRSKLITTSKTVTTCCKGYIQVIEAFNIFCKPILDETVEKQLNSSDINSTTLSITSSDGEIKTYTTLSTQDLDAESTITSTDSILAQSTEIYNTTNAKRRAHENESTWLGKHWATVILPIVALIVLIIAAIIIVRRRTITGIFSSGRYKVNGDIIIS